MVMVFFVRFQCVYLAMKQGDTGVTKQKGLISQDDASLVSSTVSIQSSETERIQSTQVWTPLLFSSY